MRLKIFREQNGLKQKELALKMGVEQNTISQWESGERLPRADKPPQLAKILGCSVDELLADAKGVKNGTDKQERI